MCKVSIVIPVYNAEKFLNECLDSLLNQTMKEIEIICVDDGSTDSSAEIIKTYEKKDSRVKLYCQKNQYAGIARNNGFKHATGEYVLFLDSDDFFEPDMVELSYNLASDNNADICVFSSNLYDMETRQFKNYDWAFRREYFTEGEVFSPQDYPHNENIFRMFNGWAWDKLIRSDFIKKHNLEFQGLRSTNDMYFTFMALAKAERIITLDKMLVHQRVNISTSISRTRDKSWNNFYLALKAMNEELKHSGLDKVYHRAFINWCTNFTLWQLRTLTGKAFVSAYELFNQSALEEFGVASACEEDFFDEDEYQQIVDIIHTPMLGRDICEKIALLENENTDHPAVSILMPSLNVGKYMRQCLESVMNQTFKNLEIICVDAGSTDGTLEIIEECAKKDSRIKVINSDIKSYGYQMNLGLAAASGDYIGIVETDDFCEPDMFASLYSAAVVSGVDVVKGNYFRYSEEGETFFENFGGIPYGTVISPKEYQDLIHAVPSIWTGLYKRKFLQENDLLFNETPGASYQDTGFIVKVWTCAQTAYIVKKPFYHYRTDNENSSVKSSAKVFCLQDEFVSVDTYIDNHMDKCEAFIETVFVRKVEVYKWNFNRLADVFRLDFLYGIRDELIQDLKNKPVENAKLSPMQKKFLNGVIDSPEEFCFKNRNYDDTDNVLWTPEQEKDVAVAKIAVIIKVASDVYDLSRTLKSICKQTIENIAIKCVCLSDTDETCLKYLRECKNQDRRIDIVNIEKGNIKDSLGFNDIEYIYCIESADILRRDALELLYSTAIESNAQVVMHNGATNKKNILIHNFINENALSELDTCMIDKNENDFFSIKNHSMYAMLSHKSVWEQIIEYDTNYFIEGLKQPFFFSMASFVFAEELCYLDNKLMIHLDIVNANMNAERCVKELEQTKSFLNNVGLYKKYQYSFINYIVSALLNVLDTIKDNGVRLNFIQDIATSNLDVQDNLEKMNQLTDDKWKLNKLTGLLKGYEWFKGYSNQKENREYKVIRQNCLEAIPKVSVIIPVYNTEKYIEACLDSIVNQTLRDIEIICVNDGSKDNSLQLLCNYASKDSRITIIDQHNGGQSSARNHALDIAQGEYIFFMDSDDQLESEALAVLTSKADEMNLEVLFFDGKCFFDEEDSEDFAKKAKSYDKAYTRSHLYEDVYSGIDFMVTTRQMDDYRVSPCMQITKKSLLSNPDLRFREGIVYEDNLYTFKVLLNAERVSAINESFYLRRLQGESTTMQQIEFRHCYGYFICYLEMMDYLNSKTIDADKIYTLYEIANSTCLFGAIKKWKQLPVEKRFIFYFLPSKEVSLFESLVYTPATKDISIGIWKRKYEKSEKKVSKLEKKLEKTKGQLQNIRKELKSANKQTQIEKNRAKKYKNSTSMKVGNALTWVPKKVKRVINKK